MDNRDKRSSTIFYTSIGFCVILYLCTYLVFQNKETNKDEEVLLEEKEEVDNKTDEVVKNITRKRKIFIIQPTTHISYMHTYILAQNIQQIIISKTMCTPEDFFNEEKHKLPKIPKASSNTVKFNEPPGLVIFITVGLLLTSLGATLLDFFRAKKDMKLSNEGEKKKPGLTRRCSLADLTVLRHSRKELLRKESFNEGSPTPKTIDHFKYLLNSTSSSTNVSTLMPKRRRNSSQHLILTCRH